MARIIVPQINQKYYEDSKLPGVKAQLARIKTEFASIVALAASLTKVPEQLIRAFIFIESGGDAKIVNKRSGAVGAMQIMPATASDIIGLESRKGRLSAAEIAILRKYLGTRLDCIMSMKYFGQKLKCNNNKGISITKADLLHPELNILIGAIYLGILVDQFTENGIIRLDKVVIKYNQGYFAKIKGNTVQEIYTKAPTETRNYIKKLAGLNNVIALSA